jgi:hypothetical protein
MGSRSRGTPGRGPASLGPTPRKRNRHGRRRIPRRLCAAQRRSSMRPRDHLGRGHAGPASARRRAHRRGHHQFIRCCRRGGARRSSGSCRSAGKRGPVHRDGAYTHPGHRPRMRTGRRTSPQGRTQLLAAVPPYSSRLTLCSEVFLQFALVRTSSALFVQVEGLARSFQPSTKVRILGVSSRTESTPPEGEDMTIDEGSAHELGPDSGPNDRP